MRRPRRLPRSGQVAVMVTIGSLAIAALAAAAGGTTVSTHRTAKGKVLASARGFSLYMFAKDKRGGKSTCYGQCAQVWPPLLTTGRPVAAKGSGLNPSLLGTVRRRNGKLEVTYNGWPLYLYAPDTKPGDIFGEGAVQFGAAWYLLNTRGNLVKPRASGGQDCNPLCPGY